jgi:O-methyltransferase
MNPRGLLGELIRRLGYGATKSHGDTYIVPPDITEKGFLEIYGLCKEYTGTSMERMYSLFKSVEYVVANRLEGDFVECGVWRGGSVMLMAMALLMNHCSNKSIFLYDTFEGLTRPTEKDVDFTGKPAADLFAEDAGSILACSVEEVRRNLALSGYPLENFVFVKGDVTDTIPETVPESISLLRLDTDWFESTYHELRYLYPLLIERGILILDDYGHWKGAKEAVDRYFSEQSIKALLHRIDYTGRICVKTGNA